MKKSIVAMAVAAAVAVPFAVQADATVYGKAHISLDYVDNSNDNNYWDVVSRASRLGVKGSEDLGGGLKAIYKMEFQIYMSDSNGNVTDNDGGSIKMRNTYVGLSGDWGTALIGRHDTPLKMSTGKLDLFSDEAGDYNTTIGFQDIRADNAVAYVSPTIAGGLTLAGAAVPSGGLNQGAADSFNDAYSLAGMYSNGHFFAAAAYETLTEELIGASQDYDKWRVGLGLMDYSGFTVTGIYENQDKGSDQDADLWQIQAQYAFGNNAVKAMYGENDADNDAGDRDAWAIGLDHNFSKRTKAYVQYAEVDYDAGDAGDADTFSVGMIHKF